MDLDEFWQDLAGDLGRLFADYRGRLQDLDVRTKADRTLLTEADLAVQELVKDRIRALDASAVIVAEEDDRTGIRTELDADPELVWVIDPIDGTAEFVRPDRHEFCSVVCLLREREPVAAFVFAPDLGVDGRPLVVTADRTTGAVCVNGTPLPRVPGRSAVKAASVTRSANTDPRPFEGKLVDAGYELKTRTTSQTLDMLRTALDIRPFSDRPQPTFDLFYRPEQKVWDGAAGLCLGETVGMRTADGQGGARLPVPVEILRQPEPTFDVTVMGVPEVVEWFATMI